jgi:hypothetical protein
MKVICNLIHSRTIFFNVTSGMMRENALINSKADNHFLVQSSRSK